jgi:hypothetical protein
MFPALEACLQFLSVVFEAVHTPKEKKHHQTGMYSKRKITLLFRLSP